MKPRLAVVLSHPIPNFAAWHRAVAAAGEIELKVLFCCDWGIAEYVDPQFGRAVRWDVPLLEGYDFEMLPIRRRPEKLRFREVDNPGVGEALDRADRALYEAKAQGRNRTVSVAAAAPANG